MGGTFGSGATPSQLHQGSNEIDLLELCNDLNEDVFEPRPALKKNQKTGRGQAEGDLEKQVKVKGGGKFSFTKKQLVSEN